MRKNFPEIIKIFLIFSLAFLFSFAIFYFTVEKYFSFQTRGSLSFQKIKEVAEIFKNNSTPQSGIWFGSQSLYFNSDIFKEVKNKLINQKADFILINLSSQKLYFYKEGKLKDKLPILTIGKKGSFWETPTGFYQVEAKIKNAYSSMGRVYMPYSLQFQGNFFIHGWPYYPNGQPVHSTFSGGCIRLSTGDAKTLFQEVKLGTPILITENDFTSDKRAYQFKIPSISAQNFLAADLKSNFIFAGKNLKEKRPIASLTKLITALTAVEYINLWKEIAVSKKDLIYTSKPRLQPGQKVTGFDLLYPLLLESSNEAAKTLSRFLGEEYFLALMNKKAKSLGMQNTHFEDAYGGSVNNHSTLEDLFLLGKYLYFNRRFILNITSGKKYDYLLSKDFRGIKFENFNCFGKEPDFVGGKIGKTKLAKETMLAIFELSFGKEKRPIIIIVLGSDNACNDVLKIKNWIGGLLFLCQRMANEEKSHPICSGSLATFRDDVPSVSFRVNARNLFLLCHSEPSISEGG